MAILLGAEKKIVFLNTHKPSPVDQATVNIVGVFTAKKDVPEQVITKITDLTGVNETDEIYKLVQAVFAAGGKQVLVYGKNKADYKVIFDGVKNDWFGTVVEETDLEKISLISKEVAARQKKLFAQISKTEDITLAESKIKAIAEDTTALFFSKNDEYTAASVAGYAIPQFPGSVLIANKLINGAVESGVTGAEQAILDSYKVNYVARMKGQLGLANGVTVTGDPIDFIHCVKALQFRLEEDITLWLKSEVKPSFYNVATLKTTILTKCKQFERMGSLVQGLTVVDLVPVEEIPKNDILNGVFTGVKVTVYYAFGIKEIRADLYFSV